MTDEDRAARRVSLLDSGQLIEPLANLTHEFYAFGKSLDLKLNGPRAPTRKRRGRLAKKITRRGGYAKADGAVQAGLRALYKATAGARTKYYVPPQPRGPGPQQIPYGRPDKPSPGRPRCSSRSAKPPTRDGSYWALGRGAAHRTWKVAVVRGPVVYLPGALGPIGFDSIESWGLECEETAADLAVLQKLRLE